MKPIDLSSLNTGSTADADYYGEKGELLISKGTVISQRHLDMLANRNNFDLFFSPPRGNDAITPSGTDGPDRHDHPAIPEFPPGEGKKASDAVTDEDGYARWINIFALPPGRKGLIQLSKSILAQELDTNLRKKNYVDRPIGPPLRNKALPESAPQRTETYKEEISRSYLAALNETETLLRLLAGDQGADAADLERIVRLFVALFVTDRNILLNVSGFRSSAHDVIFQHSLNVCLLAINVAAAYGYSEKQVLEIGMGALVHDIGMLLVPEAIRLKKGRLSEDEWYEIRKHPIVALHLLQKLKNLPERIPYIAYQVHERENATGYPRRHGSPNIHRFAKMVEVADIYEALTSPRPHRPAYLPSQGVYKLIQMSQKKLLPRDAVMAFLEYVSLFPVGSVVELSNYCIGKVVRANKTALHQPVISVLLDERGDRIHPNDRRLIDLSQHNDLRIVKTLPFGSIEAIGPMDGF